MKFTNKIASVVTLVLAISPFTIYADKKDDLKDKIQSAGKEIATDTEDAAITTKVKGLLALEKDIKSFDIHVDTSKGVVYLSGTVDTQLQANRAVELSQSVKNVTDVDDSKLKTTSSDSFMNDAYITAKVKGKIMQLDHDGVISNKNDLHVETTNGVVHVFGKVGNRKDINTIEQAVKKMNDVKDVKTNIDVIK